MENIPVNVFFFKKKDAYKSNITPFLVYAAHLCMENEEMKER